LAAFAVDAALALVPGPPGMGLAVRAGEHASTEILLHAGTKEAPQAAIKADQAGVRAAERVEGGIELGRSLTDREAIQRLRRGEDIHTSSKADAKALQKKAAPGKPIHDQAHGEGYYDHYHDANREGGHAFHGESKTTE
jgi:hypothetical protein